jgi:hypothetical protein
MRGGSICLTLNQASFPDYPTPRTAGNGRRKDSMTEACGWILVSLAMAAMGWISGQRVGYVAGRQHRRRRATCHRLNG